MCVCVCVHSEGIMRSIPGRLLELNCFAGKSNPTLSRDSELRGSVCVLLLTSARSSPK